MHHDANASPAPIEKKLGTVCDVLNLSICTAQHVASADGFAAAELQRYEFL